MSVDFLKDFKEFESESQYGAALLRLAAVAESEKDSKNVGGRQRVQDAFTAFDGTPEAEWASRDRDLDLAFNATIWFFEGGRIRAAREDYGIALMTNIYERDAREEISFKFFLDDLLVDSYAWVRPSGEYWVLITDENSWLHSNRDQHELSDEQIERVHANLESWWAKAEYRFREPQDR